MAEASSPIKADVAQCPAWCDNDTCSKNPAGEHFSEGIALPASGASVLQHLIKDYWTNAPIPLVNLRAVFNPCDGDDAPSVSIMIADGERDAEVYLRVHEVEHLIAELQGHLDLLGLRHPTSGPDQCHERPRWTP